MPRWEADGFERLQAAAFDLFDEQGFERTTVAGIAQRAGLSQRTFFNHFADKREVLFGMGSELQQAIVGEIAASDDTLPPLDTVVGALRTALDRMFEGHRAAVTRRQRIIDANPELRERELGKRATLTDAIAAALQAHGLDDETARFAASAGMLVEQTAVRRWTQPDESRPLRDLLAHALTTLRTTVSQ